MIKTPILSSFLLFLALFFGCSYALAKEISIEEFTLSNGMRVIVLPNQKVPAVVHMVWYHTGGLQDPPAKAGLAHFLEHLLFKGTPRFSEGKLSKIVAEYGGNYNAFTSHDYTAYFEIIGNKQLPLMMELEADRMQHLRFNDEIVKKERNIVMEERRLRVDNDPVSLLNEQMRAALFLNHFYGRPVIGWQHEIAQFTLKDAKEFYRKSYHPANATLIVAGAVTGKEVKELAEKYYGAIPAGPLPLFPLWQEPSQVAERKLTLSHVNVKTPLWQRYYVLFLQPQKKSLHEVTASLMLAHLLGGSEMSRLYQELVVRQQLASEISVEVDPFVKGPALLTLSAVPRENISLAQLETAIETSLKQFIVQPISEKEIARVRMLLKAETIFTQDSFKSLAFLCGHLVAAGFAPDYLNQWEQLMAKISEKELKALAQEWLVPTHSVTGWLVPSQQTTEKGE